jgi:hypothetical protein
MVIFYRFFNYLFINYLHGFYKVAVHLLSRFCRVFQGFCRAVAFATVPIFGILMKLFLRVCLKMIKKGVSC